MLLHCKLAEIVAHIASPSLLPVAVVGHLMVWVIWWFFFQEVTFKSLYAVYGHAGNHPENMITVIPYRFSKGYSIKEETGIPRKTCHTCLVESSCITLFPQNFNQTATCSQNQTQVKDVNKTCAATMPPYTSTLEVN